MIGPTRAAGGRLLAPVFIAIMCLAARAGAQEASVQVRQSRAHAFNTASLSCASGFSGALRLYGIDLDGKRVLLYRAEPKAAISIEASFLDDGTQDGLELEAFDGYGRPIRVSADLSTRRVADGTDSTLPGLSFSYRPMTFGWPPSAATLPGGDSELLAREANRRLFRTAGDPVAFGILAAWSIAVTLYAAWMARREARAVDASPNQAEQPGFSTGRRRLPHAAILVALALAAGLSLVVAVPRRADLFVVVDAMPGGSLALQKDLPDPAYRRLVWRPAVPSATDGSRPRLDYLGIRSPGGAAIPLSALSDYAALGFSRTPVVRAGSDGIERLDGGPFLAAWGVRK